MIIANKLFKFNIKQSKFLISLWGVNVMKYNGSTIDNEEIYQHICKIFNDKFNLNISHYKIEKKILYEKACYIEASYTIYLIIYQQLI